MKLITLILALVHAVFITATATQFEDSLDIGEELITYRDFHKWFVGWMVDSYQAFVPPIDGANGTLSIGISIEAEHLVSTDVVNQMTLLLRLRLVWYDERLRYSGDKIIGWNHGHNYLPLPTSLTGILPAVWVPDVQPLNHLVLDTDESFTTNSNVRIYSDLFAYSYGYNVYWERSIPVRFLCESIYPTTFPSDVLMCLLDWGQKTSTSRNYVFYDLGNSNILTDHINPLYVTMHEGIIMLPNSDDTNILVRYVFTFRRKNLFYIMFIMEPFLCVVLLISISFWYPIYWVDRVAFIIPLLITLMNVGGIASDYSAFVAQPVDARTAWLDLTTIISTLVLLPAAESALINSVFLLIQRHNQSAIRLFEIHQRANMKVWLQDLNNFKCHVEGVPLRSVSSLEFKHAPSMNIPNSSIQNRVPSYKVAPGVYRVISLLGYKPDQESFTPKTEAHYSDQMTTLYNRQKKNGGAFSEAEKDRGSETSPSGFLTTKQRYLSRVTDEQEKLLKEKACIKARSTRNFVARAILIRLLTSRTEMDINDGEDQATTPGVTMSAMGSPPINTAITPPINTAITPPINTAITPPNSSPPYSSATPTTPSKFAVYDLRSLLSPTNTDGAEGLLDKQLSKTYSSMQRNQNTSIRHTQSTTPSIQKSSTRTSSNRGVTKRADTNSTSIKLESQSPGDGSQPLLQRKLMTKLSGMTPINKSPAELHRSSTMYRPTIPETDPPFRAASAQDLFGSLFRGSRSDAAGWPKNNDTSLHQMLSRVTAEHASNGTPDEKVMLCDAIDHTMLVALKQYSSQLMRVRPDIYSIYNVIELSSFMMRMLLPPLVLAIWFKCLDPIFYSEINEYYTGSGQGLGQLSSLIYTFNSTSKAENQSNFTSNILQIMIYTLMIVHVISTVVYGRWWMATMVNTLDDDSKK